MFDTFNISAIKNSFSNVRRVEFNQKVSCALDEMTEDEEGKTVIYNLLSRNVHNESVLNDLKQMIWYDKAYCGKLSWKDLFEIISIYPISIEECFYMVSSNANLSLSQIINLIAVKYRNGLANKYYETVDLTDVFMIDENIIEEIEGLLNIDFSFEEQRVMTVEDFWSFVSSGNLDYAYYGGSNFCNRNKNISVGDFKSLYKVLRTTSGRSKRFCLSYLIDIALSTDCESKYVPCVYYSDEYGKLTDKFVIFSLAEYNDRFGFSSKDSSENRFQNLFNSEDFFYFRERSGKSGKTWRERPKKYYSDLYTSIDDELPDVPTFSCALREKNNNVRVLTTKDGRNFLITSERDICNILGYIDSSNNLQIDKLSQNIVTRNKDVKYRIPDVQTKLLV